MLLRSFVIALALFTCALPARGALRVERTSVPSGVLYDLVVPVAHVDRFDGAESAPAANPATLRQAVFELARASVDGRAWPTSAALTDRGDPWRVSLALVDVAYERLAPGAGDDGRARVEGDQLVLERDALQTRRAFMAAPLRGYTYRGSEISFVLDARLHVSDRARPARVEADFGDGAGYRTLRWNEATPVRMLAVGERVVRVRATSNDGSVQHASFTFDVRAIAAPVPHDTLPLTGTQPYNGGTATGRAFIYRADVNPVLTKPAVVIEGFDIDNTMNWDELYALLNQEGLIEELRARGYDAVVLDFAAPTDYIQRNAFVAVDLIHQVQAAIDPAQQFPLVGASMGGLVARYALAWMEFNSDPHRVRNFVSMDVPHAGANIPLGIQYWLDFFSEQSTEAAALLARLDAPAARQMLIYHHTTPPGSTGQSDPLRAVFESELASLGDYPTLPRRVALSNGSGTGANQGFAAGAQVIQYVYDSFLVDVRGNVWAVPNGGPTQILQGLLDPIFFPADAMNVTVSGTLPWDNAPGGTRNSMAQMDAVTAPYGDIVALHPNHCFIPSVSALDVATGDPFYDIAGDADLLLHTPFQAVYIPAANEAHVTVTPENAIWLLDEIDVVPTAVGPATPPRASLALVLAPNPFDAGAVVRWDLKGSARVSVNVFDVRGRRVATLLDENRPRGVGQAAWNGRDDRGVAAPAGVYFVRVEAAGVVEVGRLVRVR